MYIVEVLEKINEIHKKTNLEDIVEAGATIIEKYVGFVPKIFLKDEYKNNLYLAYPKDLKVPEIHIDPDSGVLANAVIQFEETHHFYLKNEEAKELNRFFNEHYLYYYITSIKSYNGHVKYLGEICVGSFDQITEEERKLLDILADNLGTSIYKAKLNSEIEQSILQYEEKLNLFADYVKNKLIPSYFIVNQYFEKMKKLKELNASEDPEKLKELREIIESCNLTKLDVALNMLSNIDSFVNVITNYSDAYIKRKSLSHEIVPLNELIERELDKSNVRILINEWNGGKTYIDRYYVRQFLNLLISGSLKENKNHDTLDVFLLKKKDQYRGIIRIYNGGLNVNEFSKFFEPKTVKEYKEQGNGLHFVAAKYLADLLNIDIWLNSPEYSGYTEINFNLPKYS